MIDEWIKYILHTCMYIYLIENKRKKIYKCIDGSYSKKYVINYIQF